jgi:hypothetical protein
MRREQPFATSLSSVFDGHHISLSRKAIVAAILAIALIAFEVFNFDTTQFALRNLLGDVRFGGVFWATILAVAFCAIDFAGLVRIFTPQRGREEPKAVWFLLGAWFLGTIANAVMTWWAVSVTLLSHEFGNEVLSREQLLRYVPVFVAALVWLTRILFIGAFSVAGEEVFDRRQTLKAGSGGGGSKSQPKSDVVQPAGARTAPTQATPRPAASGQPRQHAPQQPAAARPATVPRQAPPPRQPAPQPRPAAPPPTPAAPAVTYEPVDDPIVAPTPPPVSSHSSVMPERPESRIRQRPPMPGGQVRYPTSSNVRAQPRDDNFRQL